MEVVLRSLLRAGRSSRVLSLKIQFPVENHLQNFAVCSFFADNFRSEDFQCLILRLLNQRNISGFLHHHLQTDVVGVAVVRSDWLEEQNQSLRRPERG